VVHRRQGRHAAGQHLPRQCAVLDGDLVHLGRQRRRRCLPPQDELFRAKLPCPAQSSLPSRGRGLSRGLSAACRSCPR
jgi:hypothetical protein